VEQELLTLPEHLSSPLAFSGVRVTRSLVLCVMLYRSLFVLLSIFVAIVLSVLRFTDSDYPLWYLQALLNWDEKSFKLQNCFQPNDFEISRNLDVITVHARFTCCVCIGYKTASTLNDRSCNSFHFKKKLAKKKATSKRTYKCLPVLTVKPIQN
jgi:hypothetical protein